MAGAAPSVDVAALFANGGELGARLAATEWTAHPIGPPERWPSTLLSALRLLLSSRAQIVLFWGSDFLTFYNDAYAPAIGSKHPHALGQPARDHFSELWEVLEPLLSGVVRMGESYWAKDHPFPLERHGYLEETYFDISYDPVRAPDGSVQGVLCIVSDTTGRVVGERRLRTASRLGSRLADLADEDELAAEAARVLAEDPNDVPFALLYLCPERHASPRLAGWCGLPAAPNDDGYPGLAVVRRVVSSGTAEQAPVAHFAAAPPADAAAEALVLPVAWGTRTVGALVTAVSRHRALDREYRDFLDLVAAQISSAVTRQRAYEHERARAAELAALDRAKTNFFSNISHEFRTPLTLILGSVEDALSTGDGAAADRERLLAVHRNALRLLKLVNTVLDFSQLESGKLRATYAPTDLAGYTARLASTFRSAAERAGLRLVVDSPPLPSPVYVDRDMWEKIVLNLVSNALKFTFDGEIAVRVRDAGPAAVLEVTDTGVGIPADELPQLFERFHRVPSGRARSHEGTGIGLALVRELAELHGASVDVRSAVDRGTTFTVSVPYGAAHLPADRLKDADGPAGPSDWTRPYVDEAARWATTDAIVTTGDQGTRPGRILVADDNADLREYVVRLLAPHWDVVAVPDGRAALEAARAGDFDLVLSDVMMPRLDGFGLVAALRADPRTRAIPIVMLSARAGEKAAVAGLDAGADDYLVKPFSAQELVARVRASLDLGQARGRVVRQLRALTDSAVALATAQTTTAVLRVAAEHACSLAGAARTVVTAAGGRFEAGAVAAAGEPALTVPLTGSDDGHLGRIEVWCDGDDGGEPDQDALTQLARLVALRLENTRLYEAEHRIASTLQHSLLPRSLPQVPGAVLTCRYLAGSGEAEVGGDWYDAVALPGGDLVLVIGDVVGKGVHAAATMGQVRNALRAYLLEGFAPAAALDRLNRLVVSLGRQHLATVVCVHVDVGAGRLSLASAGHPPPVLLTPAGSASFLHDEALGPPVGALPDATFATREVVIQPGCRVLMYTDGLVEDRRSGLDASLRLLLADATGQRDQVDDLVDGVLARALERTRRDDIAVLALEVGEANRFTMRLPADPNRLGGLRRRLEGFLAVHGVPEDDAFDVVVAVSEAVANAIEHPVAPADPTVLVTAEIVGDLVEVVVHDTGQWREATESAMRGRGLALIGALTELEVRQEAEGTTLVMRRHVAAPVRPA